MGEAIDCREFILSGKFGPIELGDSASKVLRELGEPSLCKPPDDWCGLMNYGLVEFYVDDDRVIGITMSLREPYEDEVQLPLTDIPRGDHASFVSIDALLAWHQIGRRVDEEATDEYQTVWITTAGITLFFDDEVYLAKIGAYSIL